MARDVPAPPRPRPLLRSLVCRSRDPATGSEAVELQAKGRDGRIEPYFKTGGWKWTDGGMQADLPKERLTELFNVNQFIVSQVSPLAPLVVPIDGTGLPWLEDFNRVLKCQLIGFLQGVNKLWSGRLLRPGGFRGVDFILQDYEGTVTIRPSWGIREMSKFLANFDQERVAAYMRDGEHATWPHLELIRSLCAVEFCLDEVASGLQHSIARHRAAVNRGDGASATTVSGGDGLEATTTARVGPSPGGVRRSSDSIGNGSTGFSRGKLPSYISLASYGSAQTPWQEPNAYPVSRDGAAASGSGMRLATLPGVASSASMLNLAGLDDLPGDDASAMPQSIGMAPFQ